jgi:hypothetical protein
MRPGVLWFIKDPNDPNFQAFREITTKPVFTQFRKVFLGTMLYGVVLFSTIGLAVQLILGYDAVVTYFLSSPTSLRIFPLRLEYFDTISELPFDLFFFQFAFPQIYAMMDPVTKFQWFVRTTFEQLSRFLRLSHFILGDPRIDEESDYEEDDVPYRQRRGIARLGRRVRVEPIEGPNQSNEDDSEWEDEEESQEEIPRSPNKVRRELRYLRVPNRDNIEVIPGQKMLIWMKDSAPVFGRANETPEQVQQNWTKVYAPNHFYKRVISFFFLQLLTLGVGVALLISIPVLSGRMLFHQTNKFVWIKIDVPDTYANPVLPSRLELPTHDFYSYFAGLVATYVMYQFVAFVAGFFKKPPSLSRRNSIRRPSNANPADVDGWVNADEPFTLGERIRAYYQRNLQLRVVKARNMMYLVIFAGILCPLLIGLTLDFYFLSFFNLLMNRRQVVFLLLDWSSGAMFLRILYNIFMLMPDRRIGQILHQARDGGLFNLNIVVLNRNIFFPLVTSFGGLMLMPLFARILEIVGGNIL